MSEAQPVLKMTLKLIFPKYILKIQKCRNSPDSLASPPTHLCKKIEAILEEIRKLTLEKSFYESGTFAYYT